MKNAAIAAKAREAYATGKRQKLHDNWRNISRISPEEVLMTPWFESLGWTAQYRVTPGTNERQFALDFGHPELRLYVEIDGTSHRIAGRAERDIRRDAILASLGWSGLRILAADVRADTEAVRRAVTQWMRTH